MRREASFQSIILWYVLEEDCRQSNLVIFRGQGEEGFKLRQNLIRKEGSKGGGEGGRKG